MARRSWLKTRSILDKLASELSCPLCRLPMSDPCVLKSCNHHFCRKCVEFSLSEHKATCPMCSIPVWASEVHTDRQLETITKHTLSMDSVIKYDECELLDNVRRSKVNVNHGSSIQRRIKPRRKDSHMRLASPVHKSLTPKSRQRNVRGETPLHIAAIKGDVSVLQDLLEKGMNPNTRDFAGWTPLHESCIHGHDQIAALLLDHGAIVNASGYDGDTPLHDAVANGHIPVVRLLLSRGANPKIRNVHGLVAGSSTKMKEMEKLLHQSYISSTKSFKERKLVWLGTGLQQWQKTQLIEAARELGAQVVESFSEEVTHLITVANKSKCCPRTLKYLYAVAKGKWIVTLQWILKCQLEKQLVDEGPYEVVGTELEDRNYITYAPMRGRENEGQDLFHGYKFYISEGYSNSHPSKHDLEKLVTIAGGTLLDVNPLQGNSKIGQSNSVILVTNNPSNGSSSFMLNLSPSWIFDCLSQFKVLL